MGTVTGWAGQTLLVLTESSVTTVRIQPAANLRIFPDISWQDIHVGDHIGASGEDDSNGVMLARSIDVNVTQVWGTIAAVTPDGAWLVTPEDRHTSLSIPRDSEGRVRVEFDPTAPLMATDNQPIPLQTLLGVQPGTVVMVTGVRAPAATSVTARGLIGTVPEDAFKQK